MGYAIMSARKMLLTNRINKLNFQIMNLGEMQNALQNKMGNYQRMLNQYDQANAMMDQYALRVFNQTGEYISPEYSNDWENYFWPYAETQMQESDIEAQKKQLETQLQVAQKELESVEKGEEAAIGRATPKYA